MISTSDRRQSKTLLATSATAGNGLIHPLWRRSIQNSRLLKGSIATAAAAVPIASINELPTKISLPAYPSLSQEQLDNKQPRAHDSAASASLSSKLIGDVAVAVTVTFGVAPFLTVVDKAIVESANGTKPIVASGRDSVLSMARNPLQYIKSPTFLLMWAVYGATYSTANAFKTLEEHQAAAASRKTPAAASSFQLGKAGTFLGTTLVNSGASILKDRAYARMFSSSSSSSISSSFPKSTYAMWAMRDLSVIGSSFVLPDMVSQHLVNEYDMDRDRALSFCQLTLPVAAQFVAGPFHFLGLDLFNRQQPTITVMDRARALHQGFGPVVAARIARIAPGYGIGGVWNTKLRTAWRKMLVQQELRRPPAKNQPRDDHNFAQLVTLLGGERMKATAS